jgi:hypothetical protein
MSKDVDQLNSTHGIGATTHKKIFRNLAGASGWAGKEMSITKLRQIDDKGSFVNDDNPQLTVSIRCKMMFF